MWTYDKETYLQQDHGDKGREKTIQMIHQTERDRKQNEITKISKGVFYYNNITQ